MPDDPISEALAEFRRAWVEGHPPDVKTFLQDYSAYGPGLRQRLENFIFMMGGFPDPQEQPENTSTKDPLLADQATLGDYQLIKKLGHGGMGVVYEARQISLNRKVAVKVLPTHMRFLDDAVVKFRREAEAGGRQRHPGIVTVHFLGESEGTHYIVQELVEGGFTLEDRLKALRSSTRQPLGYFREIASLVARVADALEHAHRTGVIHRDVKPSNILLTREGEPKVTDFGLAKVENALTLSRSGDFAGTPYYMSPEQVERRRSRIDHGTDIYSLGVTLYELLTLTKPFDGDTTHEVLKKILLQEPRDPRKVNPRVPNDLAVICSKAMEKNATDRYPTMAAFKEDLERYLAGEVIRARPVGAMTRVVKRIKRNPAISAAVGLGLLMVIAVVIAISISNRSNRTTHENQGLKLLNLSLEILNSNPGRALLLALEGLEKIPGLLANNTLIKAIMACYERRTLQAGDIRCAAFAIQHDKTVTVSSDGIGLIRDRSSWGEALSLPCATWHSRPIRAVAIDPSGTRVATASDEGTAFLWNAHTGEPISSLSGHEGAIRSIAFDHQGRKVIAAGEDLMVLVWNADTGEECLRISGFQWYINQAIFSHDGSKIITASEDGVTRIWCGKTGKSLISLAARNAVITTATLSPDGKTAATATAKGLLQLWNIATEEMLTCIEGHDQRINRITFNKDGSYLASASDDTTAKVWNVADLRTLHPDLVEPIKLKGHDQAVASVAFTSNKKNELTTASFDGTVRLWEFLPSTPVFEGWHSLAFSTRGTKVALRSEDRKKLCFWDYIKETKILLDAELNQAHDFRMGSFSEDGQLFAVACSDHTVVVKDFLDGQYRIGHDLYTRKDIHSVQLSRDNRKCLVTTSAGLATIWDLTLPKNQTPRILDHGEGEQVVEGKFSPDIESTDILTLNDRGTAFLWDSRTESILHEFSRYDKVKQVSFSQDGSKVLLYTQRGRLGIFNIDDLNNPRQFGLNSPITSFAINPIGTKLLTSLEDGTICIWDVEDDTDPVIRQAHWKAVQQTVISQDGSRALTASKDGTIRVWIVATGEEHLTLPFDQPIRFASFSANNEEIWVNSDQGQVFRYPLDVASLGRRKKPRDLFSEERQLLGLEPMDGTVSDTKPDTPSRSPERLNQLCWKIVQSPFHEPKDYEYAAMLIASARSLDPLNSEFLKTSGYTNYRLGDYDSALADLEQYQRVNTETPSDSDPILLALQALTCFKLFDAIRLDKTAEEYRDRFETGLRWLRLISASGSGHDNHLASVLLEEVEAVMNSKSHTKTDDRVFTPNSMEPLYFISSFTDEQKSSSSIMRFDPMIKSDTFMEATSEIHNVENKIMTIAVNPAGNEIAFLLKEGSEGYSICILDPDSMKAETVFKSKAIHWTCLAWHPNGNKIYFTQAVDNISGTRICYVEANKGFQQSAATLLLRPGYDFYSPGLSGDGSLICFTHLKGQDYAFGREVWLAHLNRGGDIVTAPQQLTKDRYCDMVPCFAVDDQSLLWSRHGSQEFGWLLGMDLNDQRIFERSTTKETDYQGINEFSQSNSGFIAYVTKKKTPIRIIRILDSQGSVIGTLEAKDRHIYSPCFIPN